MSSKAEARSERLDEIIAEYLQSVEAGEPLDRDELLAQYPELASELQEFFADQERFARMAVPLIDSLPRRQFVPPTVRYFGGYELLDEIARGGMGVVYKARQERLNRVVAVKMILSGHLAAEEDVKRFQSEAQAAAGLQHPHIVSVHEVGQHAGHHYFSMDYVEGRSLAELVRDNPLSPRRAAGYVRQAAKAIHYAHQQGTLHRDLKPSNILIDGHDQVRITDFGLAMRVEGDSELTRTGQVLGSPSYMPPEQAQGKRSLIGPASDVYALGAILYELLTGRPPFRADSTVETIQQVISTEPVSPRLLNPRVPRDLETICLKCLEKEPHKRYGTAQLLADDLGRYARGEPIQARPLGRLARGCRWCRRNSALATLTAASILLLFAIGVVATLAYVREARLRGAEVQARRDAVREKWTAERALADEATARREADLQKRNAESNAIAASAAHRRAEELLANLQTAHKELREHADTIAEKQRESYRALLRLAVAQATGTNVALADANLKLLPEELRGWEWRYAKRLCRADIAVFEGQKPVAFSADGRYFASCSSDGVLVRRMPTGEEAFRSEGHVFAFSSDGTRIACAHADGTTTVRNVPAGEVLATAAGASFVNEIVFSTDDAQIAACFGRTVRIWDSDTGEVLETFRQPSDPAICLNYSADGRYLVVGGSEVFVWDVQAGREAPVLSERLTAALIKGPPGLEGEVSMHVADVFFLPGADLLAVAQADSVKLFDFPAGKLVHTLSGHVGGVLDLSFDRSSKSLATASSDGTIRCWDVRTGLNTRTLPWHDGAVESVMFSPDGQWLVSASNQKIKLWDLSLEWDCRVLPIHTDGVYGLSFSADGRLLASGGGRYGQGRTECFEEVRVIDPKTGERRFSIDLPRENASRFGVIAVALSPDGAKVAAGGCGGRVTIWDTASGRLLHTLERVGSEVRSIRFSPKGQHLVVAGNRYAGIWDAANGEEIRRLGAQYAVFSADGRTVFGVSSSGMNGRQGNLLGFDVGSGRTLFAVPITPGAWRIAVSSDGALLALALDTRNVPLDRKNEFVQLRDARTGEIIRVLKGEMKRDYAARDFVTSVYGVSFSPDGRRLATASGDKTVRVWDVDSGEELLMFPHPNQVFCVEFSPDGRWLASASGHWTGPRRGEVRLWDAGVAPAR